jgi:eukaryotic-like serine/threonine-protein kinase
MVSSSRAEGAFDRTVLIERPPPEAHVPDDPFVGTHLGGSFVVRRVLGEGAMGRLYEASHERLDRRFAVKVLHRELSRRDDLRVRFEREARVMGRLRSDHVVDVVDVLTAPDGRTCIVTELLEGETLEAYVEARGGRLGVGDAVHLTRQCLRGLSAAHALSVVHRDVKPDNLFLARDSSGRITLKLLDFGIAKSGGDAELTAAATIMGTPAYMAPEQARSSVRADVRSDLYALGAVLYRVLAGRPPFLEEDVQATLVRVLESAPERLTSLAPAVPPGLAAVVERAMARDPGQRYASAQELDLALAPFDTGPGPELGDPAARAQSDDPSRRAAARVSTWRARLLRPLVACALLVGALFAGIAGALAAGLLTRLWSGAPLLTMPERVLCVLVGAGAMMGVAVSGGRAFHRAYGNAAEVAGLGGQLTRVAGALVGGLGVWAGAEVLAGLVVGGSTVWSLTPLSGAGLGLGLALASLWASVRRQ